MESKRAPVATQRFLKDEKAIQKALVKAEHAYRQLTEARRVLARAICASHEVTRRRYNLFYAAGGVSAKQWEAFNNNSPDFQIPKQLINRDHLRLIPKKPSVRRFRPTNRSSDDGSAA